MRRGPPAAERIQRECRFWDKRSADGPVLGVYGVSMDLCCCWGGQKGRGEEKQDMERPWTPEGQLVVVMAAPGDRG